MERRDILYLTGILLAFAVVISPAMAVIVPPKNHQEKPFQDIWDAIGVLQQQMSSFTDELAAQSARIDAGDTALQGQLEKAIQDGDAALQGQLNSEITSRQAVDATLTEAIADGDTALQGQLNELKGDTGACSCTVSADEFNALKERVAALEAKRGKGPDHDQE